MLSLPAGKKPTQNNEKILEKIEQLTSKIQQNPYSKQHTHDYVQRSEQFEMKGDVSSAIVDLSKSLIIEPTCQGYVKRGKLYASSEMFYYAFQDFEEAEKLYKEEKKYEKQLKQNNQIITSEKQRQTVVKIPKPIDRQYEIFLQRSTAIVKLPELKKVAKDHENYRAFMPSAFNSEFNKMMAQIIEQRLDIQMKQINKNYEKLLNLVKEQENQIKKLQKDMQNKVTDYESIFYKEMEESTMSNLNKQKCSIYYCTLLSQMERFYLSAKVLSEFDEKISFEDCADSKKYSKIGAKSQTSYSRKMIQKIFKLFEKNQSKLERIGQIMKQIPHIGTIIKIIKSSIKLCGWFESVKVDNECENILATRPTVSSFNKMSAKVAYEMYREFKVEIITKNKSEIYKKNCWEKVSKVYKKFKRNEIAARVYKQIKPEEKDYVKEMGEVHSSILMSGIAYGIFRMPIDSELEGEGENWQKSLFERISQIEDKLINTEDQQQTQQIQINEKSSTGCIIF